MSLIEEERIAIFDMHAVMERLAVRRPIFHSEADFQRALAGQIEEMHACEISLEHKPFPNDEMQVDIWLPTEGVAIELKRRTRSVQVEHGGEQFTLKNHSAEDQGRYDYVKDVQRLEKVVDGLDAARAGFAVLLTNDPLYWNRGRGGTISDAFFLYEGRHLAGRMEWAAHARKGSTQGREEPLSLRGSYDLRWRDYSDLPVKYAQFRYLVVKVN